MWIVTTDTGNGVRTSQHGGWLAATLRAVLEFYLLYPESFPCVTMVEPGDCAQHGD